MLSTFPEKHKQVRNNRVASSIFDQQCRYGLMAHMEMLGARPYSPSMSLHLYYLIWNQTMFLSTMGNLLSRYKAGKMPHIAGSYHYH